MYYTNDIRSRIASEARRGDWQTVAEKTGRAVKTVYAVAAGRRENVAILQEFESLLDERKARLASKGTSEEEVAR
jgi:hypothetical protein